MIRWDAQQYSLFSGERSEPNIDLIGRLPDDVLRIVDLGCGTGDCSTRFLSSRYPNADILAVDSSAVIIDAARTQKAPDSIRWTVGTIENFDQINMDLIYMGSVFQWVAQHEIQLPRLIDLARPGGCIALHMPLMFDKPFYRAILEIASLPKWEHVLADQLRTTPVLATEAYEILLKRHTSSYRIWRTTYYHPFANVECLLAWAKGAPLRPVQSLLAPDSYLDFCTFYRDELAQHYMNLDGSCTLPFERLFLVAFS